jgi:hypothetical protein
MPYQRSFRLLPMLYQLLNRFLALPFLLLGFPIEVYFSYSDAPELRLLLPTAFRITNYFSQTHMLSASLAAIVALALASLPWRSLVFRVRPAISLLLSSTKEIARLMLRSIGSSTREHPVKEPPSFRATRVAPSMPC